MRSKATIPINTLDEAFDSAKQLAADLRTESRARRNYRVFSAFTEDRLEALTAYLIWRIKGEHLVASRG